MMEEVLTTRERRILNIQLAQSKAGKKTKVNVKGVPARDQCQTPPYALLPLLSHIPKEWLIWEPAAGEGLLAEALHCMNGNAVIETDLNNGNDFFRTSLKSFDCIVTNPPYSVKYHWLERCYELRKPFALLMPVDVIAAQTAQSLFQRYGVQILLLDKRVNFKMPNLGWDGEGSDYSVEWFCWGFPFLREVVTFGHIPALKGLPDWMRWPQSRLEIRKNARH